MNKEKIKVRFAPSPTGYLHIGGLRSALYNYLFAKNFEKKKEGNKGEMILRIEDTDQKRFVKGAAENLVKSLSWAKIEWNEGVTISNSKLTEKGESGPYFQSKRLDIYKKYASQLVKNGKAYYCFCEPERLEQMREGQQKEKKAPMYDRYCLQNVSEEKINENLKNNCPYTIRLKIPQDEIITFEDIIRGKVSYKADTIDDQVLMKSDGFPTYHLASVVDDHLMGITHVIRGEEWLPSTPKHVLLYQAFGWDIPKFAHLPLLLSKERKKLSKRDGDVAVEEYIKNGYLPEALMNFVAFLGWHPGKGETQEIFSLDGLIKKFNLENVHKGGAIFDIDKLNWINSQYIKELSLEKLYEVSLPFLQEKDFFINAPEDRKSEEFIKKFLEIEKERLVKFSEIGESNKFFFQETVEPEKEMLFWKEMTEDELKDSLETSKLYIEKLNDSLFDLDNPDSPKDYNKDKILAALFEASEKKYTLENGKVDRGKLFWPLRVALTGAEKSPPPSDIAWVLGKDESLRRIDNAISML